MQHCQVAVVGAGPTGLVVALGLARAGIQVTVIEAEPGIARNLRGSTFHPSTLDMLDRSFGVVPALKERGLVAPTVQYRRRHGELLGEFDFGELADLCAHPYRLQAEQYKLCEALSALLHEQADATVRFGTRVSDIRGGTDVEQEPHAPAEPFVLALDDGSELTADYVVGADGASSVVRRSAGIEFEGFTWPERFLVVSTPFDFAAVIPGLSSVSYVADPAEWYFLLQVPELWRVMFPIPQEESDADAQAPQRVQERLNRVWQRAEPYVVRHVTLYNVHQRVAVRYRSGRIFLVGDAAHVNNPLGGMGMNGGIHDAFNLVDKLVPVLSGDAEPGLLDAYEAERRPVALEYVQRLSIQNKRDLEASDAEAQAAFAERLKLAMEDPAARRAMLLRISMYASLGVR